VRWWGEPAGGGHGGAGLYCRMSCVPPPPSGTGRCAVTKTANVPMRDGALLRAHVYRPTAAEPD
jgi:predicted acyl esterase